MNPELRNPFETIESAHNFVALLAETVMDTKRELQADAEKPGVNVARRLDAIRLAVYTLEKLEFHMNKSRRMLNDLRTLRRHLLQDRPSSRSDAKATAKVNVLRAISVSAGAATRSSSKLNSVVAA
jgi:hypothetical protein